MSVEKASLPLAPDPRGGKANTYSPCALFIGAGEGSERESHSCKASHIIPNESPLMPSFRALQNRCPPKLCLHVSECNVPVLCLQTLTLSAALPPPASGGLYTQDQEPSLPGPCPPFLPPHLSPAPIFHHSLSTPDDAALRCLARHCVYIFCCGDFLPLLWGSSCLSRSPEGRQCS